MNTPLSTFSVALARLILCGGGGLAPAWGPLHHIGTHEADRYPWDPTTQRASGLQGYLYDDGGRIECWSLPLDAESPWPARLALVAAWMVGLHSGAGHAEIVRGKIHARGAFSRDENESVSIEWWMFGVNQIASWDCRDGLHYRYAPSQIYDLPTLLQHLQTHPPVVALLLALFDVPEVRARVETP